MTSDLNRFLTPGYPPGTNLPKEIIRPQGVIRNYYTAGGAKTGKKLFDPRGTLLYHEQYYGDLVVKNGQPSRILHADGVINLSSRGVEFTYHIKDHLGNVRVVITPGENNEPEVLQVNDYYPFGMVHTTDAIDNKYLYNGKEEQEMPGRWLDYGARFYDAQLGRWHGVDPLADSTCSWTPYRYAYNNPMNVIDPDGRIEWPLKGNSAVNKRDTNNGGWGLRNTVVRTSTYLDTDRPPGTSNPHIGIDYRASEGTTFYSLGDGKVTNIGESKKGGKFITVEYEGGDQVSFRHIKSTDDALEIGTKVYEGQPLGKSGKTGTQHPHLHIDAKNKDGNRVDPENRNYGIVTNQSFFEKHNGDWRQLMKAKEDAINELNRAGNELLY